VKPAVLAAVFGLYATQTTAEGPRLDLPIDCTLGRTCFIQNYVDRDPGPGATDFACGTLTNDGHKGTDFALTSLRAMQAGVDVRAAAPGTVVASRDGMPDTGFDPARPGDIAGRECGNGVLLDHGGGWQTQYCHLKLGSVRVRSGQLVRRGAVIGRVGQSGRAQFPHVHLSVRENGATVDPFRPGPGAGCGTEPTGSMWADPLRYVPGGMIAAGFSAGIPDYGTVKSGGAASATISGTDTGLVLWAYLFGAQRGDRIVFRIVGPSGPFLEQSVDLTRTQAQLFRAVGKMRAARTWPHGTYQGTATLIRDGQPISEITATTLVTD